MSKLWVGVVIAMAVVFVTLTILVNLAWLPGAVGGVLLAFQVSRSGVWIEDTKRVDDVVAELNDALAARPRLGG